MPLVWIGTLPTPFSPASVPLPPETGGRGHTSLRVGGWGESQFRRGAYTLWYSLYVRTLWLHLNPPSPHWYTLKPHSLHTQYQEVTKSLSWLTNSALVYEPKCGGGGGCGVSANEYSYEPHGVQINFGDLTPYLTYAQYTLGPFLRLILTVRQCTEIHNWILLDKTRAEWVWANNRIE